MLEGSCPYASFSDAMSFDPADSQIYVVLVHYHELGLKGRNRPTFERQLISNINKTLKESEFEAKVERISGRILVFPRNYEKGLAMFELLKKVPGVARVSLGEKVSRTLEGLNQGALRVLELSEPFNSFKVAARRANTNFYLDSMMLNREIGAYLVQHTEDKTVKMTNPDVTVHVEVIKNQSYVYAFSKPAVGGLPVGTAGKLVCLLSSGLDSPVAAWQMIRRGASVTGLHFSGAPQTADSSSHLVREIATAMQPYGGFTDIHCLHFGNYQRAIALVVPEKLRIIFYRRLMYATACELAGRIGAKGIVTGESLGQVASQTIDNILAVDAVATLPVLRPLIGTDKKDIITQAEDLGTFAISTRSTDDCCTLFMPRSPETHAKLQEVEELWQTLPHAQWVEELLSG
ncbi:MAG: tRNA 4-thiouridine(8) synthase ThiI [Coriobacteriia bacterium]|nr:tRNA 4-thiouridine(8) synthase ThiI [Coriobacteriia bacterium]